jgi:hypothetical protein
MYIVPTPVDPDCVTALRLTPEAPFKQHALSCSVTTCSLTQTSTVVHTASQAGPDNTTHSLAEQQHGIAVSHQTAVSSPATLQHATDAGASQSALGKLLWSFTQHYKQLQSIDTQLYRATT